MNNEKALEILKMLRDYVNENWDEEYRGDIDDVNEMYDYLVSVISNSNVVGNAVINGKPYLISEGAISEKQSLSPEKKQRKH